MEKLRHFTLSPQTKTLLAQAMGVDFDTLQNLDPDQAQQLVTTKLGHAVVYERAPHIDACPMGRTIQEVDTALDQIITDHSL